MTAPIRYRYIVGLASSTALVGCSHCVGVAIATPYEDLP